MTALLEVDRISRRFGGIRACHEVSLRVEAGSITSLIGPNGAGKTTMFNVMTGLFPPSGGAVHLLGADGKPVPLHGLRPDEITAEGVARTFQNIRLYGELTVLENVKLGEHAPTERKRLLDQLLHTAGHASRSIPRWGWGLLSVVLLITAFLLDRTTGVSSVGGVLGRLLALTLIPMALASFLIAVLALLQGVHSVLPLPGTRKDDLDIERASLAYLEFVGLLEKADELAANLPYGEQRKLEIARALASGPRLLLLDEPAAGMNPTETDELMGLIRRIRDAGVTVLLIEHDMKLVMDISDRVVVLDHGEKIAEGTPDEVRGDPKVIEAYLGRGAA